MALQAQNISVPLYGGLDTKTDEKFVAVTNTLTANNVRYFGVNRCDKRYGQTALTQTIGNTGASITAGKALGVYNNELLEYDGSNVYAYATAQESWFPRGQITEVSLSRTPVIRTAGNVFGIASAVSGALEVYAWEDSRGGVYYAARDSVSGTFAVVNTLLDVHGTNPQIVVCGPFVYIFYVARTFIKAAQFVASNPSAGILTTFSVVSSVSPVNSAFAVASTGTQVLLAWSTGVAVYSLALLSSSLSVILQSISAVGSLPGPTFAQMCLSTDGSTALLTICGSGSIQTIVIDAAGLGVLNLYPITSAGVYHAVGVGVTPTGFDLYYDGIPVNASMPSITVDFVDASNITPGPTLYGLALASQPVLTNGQVYLVGTSPLVNFEGNISQQSAFYLLGGTPGALPMILERFSGDEAYLAGTSIPLPSVVGNQLFTGLAERTALLASAAGTVYSGSGLSAFYFTFPTVSNFKAVPFGTTAVIECGNTYTYDGSQIVESGFWEFPDGISSAAAFYPGTGLNQGQYVYQVTYEWVDAAGNNHYSAPSYPITVLTPNAGQNNQVALEIPFTALTRKPGVTVNIYRTATSPTSPVGTDTGLGLLYKIPNATVTNLGTSGVPGFIFVDTNTDVSLQGQLPLYAPFNGSGELENNPPPPFAFMIATKTRVFGIAQDDITALWYSKPLAPNRPVEWSEAQIIRIETDGGPPTALGFLDTQAIVFKSTRIYFLPGDGPNSQGGGTLFGALQLIATTSGCNSQPSVLVTHDGLWYQSSIGLQMLDRSLTVQPLPGIGIQRFAQTLSFTGAVAVSGQNQLRWTSSDGTALVLDYLLNEWATYTGYDCVGYVAWNGTFARLKTTGQVLFEDPTTYLDDGQPVTMTLETSWLKPATMAQGFAAVWYAEILGQYFSPHQLQIEVAYDYNDVATQVSLWNVNASIDTSTFGSGSPYGSDVVFGSNTLINTAQYQLRVSLQRQVCEAVKFKIYDVQITGQSCSLSEVALQLGVIAGINRVPVKQQA